MTTKIIFILPAVLFFISSCGEKNQPSGCYGGSYEFRPLTGMHDTINLTDCNNNKQGRWYIFKSAVVHHTVYSQSTGDTFTKKTITADAEDVLAEHGFYKDNKKQGFWIKYSPAGKILDCVEFKDGVAVVK